MTPEQEMLRESAARQLARTYGFEQRRRIMESGGHDAVAWASFAEMGWLAAVVPAEAGGFGGLVEAAILSEAFGEWLVLEPYCGFAVAAELLRHGGRSDLLLSLLAGERIVLPTPRTGAGAETDIIESGDGRIDGRVALLPGASVASHFIVPAGERLFLVEASTPGVYIETVPLIDGRNAGTIILDSIPAEPIVSNAPLLRVARETETIVAGGEMLGMIARVITLSIEHLSTRKQFGVPLATFQAMQHRIADMVIEQTVARGALDLAFNALEAPAGADRNYAFEVALHVLGESTRRVCESGIQVHGGMGMTDEHQVSHYLRRLIALEAILGTRSRAAA